MVSYGLLGLANCYTALFLLWLIWKFAQPIEECELFDSVLGKRVPAILCLQNQKLLEQAVKDAVEVHEEAKISIRL